MNCSGNMPDWHQYNSAQPIGSEVPSVSQNVIHSQSFGPSLNPRRLNGSGFSLEGLSKPPTDASYNARNFPLSPNTMNGSNGPETSPMGSTVQIPGCLGHYGTPSPRNTMIESTNSPLESRNGLGTVSSESIGHQTSHLQMNGPVVHLNSTAVNSTMTQRNTSIQGPITPKSRQGLTSYMPCKGPCCNPENNVAYHNWEKFGPYPPNVQYRDANYPVDNRRFNNDFNPRKDAFDNREAPPISAATYAVDPRRNFSDYKYRKEPLPIPRGYAPPPPPPPPPPSNGVQNYPVQNYFSPDYQKYPTYPMKDYSRETSVGTGQNPGILKYQEQSVIVQQKYFTKQIQYPNGATTKDVIPTSLGANIISRTQNPYFNPQLGRDLPRDYTENTALANRGLQATTPMQSSYSKYQMYQQKIAMQRFSMENHLRELSRIPGYQSHPKYQECILRYRELLRLQQTVEYQSTVQDSPRVVNAHTNEEIPPINLQFDQNGVLINSNYTSHSYSGVHRSTSVQNSKNLPPVNSLEVTRLSPQQSERYQSQERVENQSQAQDSSSFCQTSRSRNDQADYSVANDFRQQQFRMQTYANESVGVAPTECATDLSSIHGNSKDFADKPELDVRQFLANWDESEDEDGPTATALPEVVLSNAPPVAADEYENVETTEEVVSEEADNCSEMKDCNGTEDRGSFVVNETESKPSHPVVEEVYERDVSSESDVHAPSNQDCNDSDTEKKISMEKEMTTRSPGEACGVIETIHVVKPVTDQTDDKNIVKLLCENVKAENNEEDGIRQELPMKNEEESVSSITAHIDAYNADVDTETYLRNGMAADERVDDGRSNCERRESVDSHSSNDVDSSESCSESDSSDSETNESESVTSTDKVSKGSPDPKNFEISVNSQEMSAIPPSLESNCTIVDNQNLQKQHSFVSEESHNPDDISLPDLPTSEYTPISTTLNTPIHSDSEDSSEHIIDLTIPANPIEIIQNSPMLSFTHSPIKMEPYERFDDTDPVDETSRDMDFDANNSRDNDFDHSRSPSSTTTSASPQFANVRSDEYTSETESVDVSNDKSIVAMKPNDVNLVPRNNLANDIIDLETRESSNKIAHADCQSWPTNNAVKEERHGFRDMECEDCKLESRLETSTKSSSSSIADENNESENVETRRPFDSNERDETIEVESDRLVQVDDGIVLNLAKPHVLNSDPPNVANNLRDGSRNDGMVSSNNDECTVTSKRRPFYRMSTERTELHATPSVCEVKLDTEISENQPNFSGPLHIPLIPGEDFDEPKMPVLPMEGNCLTKILKNTSPITNLDVLGSDDEKLGKMDDLWIEVDCVEANSKVDGNSENPCKQRTSSSLRKLRKIGKEFDGIKTCWKTVDSGIHEAKVNSKILPIKDNEFARIQSSGYVERSPLDETRKQTESGNIDRPRRDSSSRCDSREEHDSSQLDLKSSSSNLLSGDCLANNGGEKSKCRVKANHINDIATKLLENARQIEPEKKMEVLKKEDGMVRASVAEDCDTDGTKKRMKLLKEFRKVKNKRWGTHHSVLPSTTGDLGDRIESTSALPNAGLEMENVMITVDTKRVEDSAFEQQTLNESVSSNSCQSNSVIPDPLDNKIEDKSETICDSRSHFIATSDPKSSDNVKVQESEKYEPSEGNESPEVDNVREANHYSTLEIDNSDSGQSRLPENFVQTPGISCETNVDSIAINLSTSSRDVQDTFTNDEDCSIEASSIRDSKNTESSVNAATVNGDSNLSELTRTKSNESFDNNRKESQEFDSRELAIEKDDQNGNAVGSSDVCREIDVSSDTAVRAELQQPNKSDDLERPTEVLRACREVMENLDHETANEYEKTPECADEKPSEHSMSCSTEELASDEKNDQAYESAVVLENSENLKHKSWENEDTLLDVTPESRNIEANSAIDEKVRATKENLNVDVDGKQEKMESSETYVERSSLVAEPKSIGDELIAADETSFPVGDFTNREVTEKKPRKAQGSNENSNSAVISDNVWKIDDDSIGMQGSKRANDDECSNKISGCSNVSADDRRNFGSTNTIIDTFFTHDFNNFDVAPNIENDEEEQNEDWKHSRAHARYEDCERYKNPDNLTDPILTSLETLDNLNTVPVYTTKDGKITYSPNPKFTYRALIVEAREREGYPATLNFYHDGSKAQESYHRGRSQGVHRKRKLSEDCGGASNYGKRNHYEPRYHGETSSKYSSDSRHRRSAAHPSKYRRYSRDDYSHNSSYDNDAKKARSSERLVQEKITDRYNKYSETGDPSIERRKRKDIGQTNFQPNDRNVSKQSKEPQSLDVLHSRSRKNTNQGPINVEYPPCRSQTKEQRSSTNNVHEDIFGPKNHPADDSKNDENVKEILPEKLDTVARPESRRHSCSTDVSVQRAESDNLTQEQYKASEIVDSKADHPEVCTRISAQEPYEFPPNLDDTNCKTFNFQKSMLDENCSRNECRKINVESDNWVKDENVSRDMAKCEIQARDSDEIDAVVDKDFKNGITSSIIGVDASNIEDDLTTLSNQNVDATCPTFVREVEKNDEREQETTSLGQNLSGPDLVVVRENATINAPESPRGCNQSLVDKLDPNSRRDLYLTSTDKLDNEHVDEAIQKAVELMVESVEVESSDKTDSMGAVKNEDDAGASSEASSMHRDGESNGQHQFEKYIAYSPPTEHSENLKVIPKLVIKKADPLSHKHSYVGSPTTPPAELRSNKIWSKETPSPKSYPHPKIPKILIRNAKSRPSTPSIEEVSEIRDEYEITVKDEVRIPKVKIRLEEKGVQGSSLSTPESKSYVSENKIPIMKIKLDNLFGECFRKNDHVSKTVPKMKIKKLKNSPKRTGCVKILPVSIPKMLVCREKGSETAENRVMCVDDEKSSSSNPIAADAKEMKIRSDSKKIPKLKIKRQGSNCSLESHGKRRNQSPIESDMKKSKKSLATEIGAKKQSNNKSQNASGIVDVPEKVENGEKLSVICNENSATVLVASHVKSNPMKSDSSDKIPKVIIKRASSSAEFKCELSKTKRDEIIKTKKWQPEVKLQRSWVLDCMAKDLNLDKLTLKLATPDSISKKCTSQKKGPSVGSNIVGSSEKQDTGQKILYKSKSTSDLVSFRDNYGFCRYDAEQSNEDEKTASDAREKSECHFAKLSTSSENIPNKKKKRFENREPVRNRISSLGSNDEFSYLPNTFDVAEDIIIDNKVLDENMNSKNKVFSKMNSTVSQDACQGTMKTRNDIYEGYATSYHSDGMKNQDGIKSCNKSSDNGSISKEEKKTSRNKDDKCGTLQSAIIRNETGSLNDPYISARKKTAAECNSEGKEVEAFEDRKKLHFANYCKDATEILHILSGSGSPDPTNSTIELSTDNIDDTNSIGNLRGNEIRTPDVFATTDVDLQRDNFLDSNENHVSDLFVKDCEYLKDGVKLSNGLDKSVDVELRCLHDDTRRTVEVFSTSPDVGQCNNEISSFPFDSKEINICLYHEDAIPTQYELELGITNSVSPVPIEQSNDFVDCYEEVDTYSDASYVDHSKLANTVVQTDVAVSTKLLRNDRTQGTMNLSCDVGMDTNCSSEQNPVTPGDMESDRNNSYYTDLLVKEVLAAKEMLRKCLASSSREDQFKSIVRPKTAAEKKQGASFNLSTLSSGSDTLGGNMINRFSENSILTGENSGKKIRLFNGTGSNETKPLVDKSKARLKLNVVEYEKQHSKNEKNIFTVQPSKTAGNFEAVDDTEQTDSYITPQRGWIELEDSVELSNDKTTISLKNSKRFVENTSCRKPSKNIPELINSKDNKCKSKSTRHDAVDWKIVEKSTKKSTRAVISKSSVDVVDRREKSVSDTESCKYKSLNLASGRLLEPVTDKPKFKSYKIPKILKNDKRESKSLLEEFASTRYGDNKMPILEPQVDFDSGFLVSNSDTNKDSSRPPTLVTSLNAEVIDQSESWDLDQKSCQPSPTTMERVASAEETRSLDEKVEIRPLYEQEMTVAYVVRDLAYHEKATIKHKRYCTLCERWFPTVARHRRHLTGYQHRHTELTQRRTIHALFTLFTGKPCPRIQPASVVRIDCVPGELTPLQIAVQGLASGLDKTGGDSRRPSREDE